MRSLANGIQAQRGFTLIEVMLAATVLSVFVLGIGASWLVADRRVNDLVIRQKAILVANAEMERVSTLYNGTFFGVFGPATTTGYDGLSSIPTTRLSYPTSLNFYMSGSGNDYTTTSANTFQSGSEFQVWIATQISSSLNRSYVWIDRSKNIMGRVSWVTNTITPSDCNVGDDDDCGCLNFIGFGFGRCRTLSLYLEYPYRLTGGAAVAVSPRQIISLGTIVGRSQ